MNFRLPFQISRVSAICQSSSPVNLISKFTPIYGNHVKGPNQNKQNTAHHTRIITTKCTYRTFHSPFNVFQQKAFLHNLAQTEEAVKQRVRHEQYCDYELPEEPKLAFRQSSKIQCCKCVDYKPCVAPPLVRPAKLYDDSKCQYVHKCNPDLCNINPPRKDDICRCCPIERKKLPRLRDYGNCRPCVDYMKRPKLLPPLCKPTKYYDPDKMKYDHGVCKEPKCIRQDDIRGYKIEPKELPVIPNNDCQPCVSSRPLTAPNLIRPCLRYDPTCIPYPHSDCPCNDNAPRRDDFCCEQICRKLPPMPCSDCIPCQQYIPTECPALRRPKARYDSTDMKYKHICPQSPCDTPSLRRDNNNNIISVTLTRKKLPQLKGDNTCQPCIEYRPLTAPELVPPLTWNNNLKEEQKRSPCIDDKCIRRDGQIEICRKCLPPVPIAHCAKPCLDIFTPCTTPKFAPPVKLYDDSTCKYRHNCIPEYCERPRRLDDTCYKITQKLLPKPPYSSNCKPCTPCIKAAPPLCRPFKKYDDSKQKYVHPECPEDPCKTIPRSDDYTGCKDEVKTLQPFKALKCKPCQQYFPTRAPELCRPHPRYDDSCMLYEHKNCPPPCEGSIFRRDHYLWEGPKKLPKVQCGTICEPCQQSYPSVAPPIGRPHKLYEFPYDPVRVKECPPECPPRRDDLFCWKPKRKRLPSFKDCDQSCCYSTLSWSNSKSLKGPVSSKCHFEKKGKTDLRHHYSTQHTTNCCKRSPDKDKYKSKHVLKEKCTSEQKQVDQRTGKSEEARYYIVKEPTWKCIDVSETRNTNLQKKYDYSIEKWLREGAEQIVEATSKSITKKIIRDHVSSFSHTKYSTGSECITPVRFTGFDKSEHNEFLCIKKNNKLQPLRVGSAFKFDDTTTCCNKSTMVVSKDININVNEKKITTASVDVPKNKSKQFTFSTIIEERITQQIPSIASMPTSNFILKLNNRMRSAIFKKLSNFFKRRENAARDRKIIDALKNKANVIVERNKSTSLNKEFMANVCEKYNIQVDAGKLSKMNRNKPYIVQKYKNQGLKIKMDKPAMSCSSKPAASSEASKRDETNKVRSLPKQIKIRTDQIRNFSTHSKGGQLCYKHIDISDDYIGKIYKVKLKKIGVKNLMLEKNDPDKRDEEPHTICYICKVVPRYQPVVHDDPPDIENVKINYYREKRNTIE